MSNELDIFRMHCENTSGDIRKSVKIIQSDLDEIKVDKKTSTKLIRYVILPLILVLGGMAGIDIASVVKGIGG